MKARFKARNASEQSISENLLEIYPYLLNLKED